MIDVGLTQKLKVLTKTAQGFELSDLEESETVLLPSAHVSRELVIGDQVDAFIYVDTTSKNKTATLLQPVATVGEFAFLKVMEIHEFGSFLSWGIEKDLLVPGNEQKEKFGSHGRKLVRICMEDETQRIFGTTKFGKYIEAQIMSLDEGDRVTIIPTEKTKLGYRVIVEKKFLGMIYHNEVFEDIELGESYYAVVKTIRDDGLIDVALQIQGVNNLYQSQEKVLDFLERNNGESHLNDKSSPEEIKRLLGMSKKTFKSVIGMLYKNRKISIIKGEGIKLL